MAQQENLGSDGDELKRLDIEKRRLECEKLRAEIAEISLSWWQRPGYVGSVLTLAALLTGWVSGYFPSERESLKREIDNLRTEKTNRTQEALLLNSDLARLRDERNEFKQQVASLDGEKQALAGEIKRAENERDEVKRQLGKLEADKKTLDAEMRQIQDKVDSAYVRLKISLTDAQYAISHIAPVGGANPFLPRDKDRFADLLKKLSSTDAELVRSLDEAHRFSMDIADITVKDLKTFDKALSALGSAKRISLQILSPLEVRAADGKVIEMEKVKKAEDRQLLDWFRTRKPR